MTHRFELVETRAIPELNTEASLYRHPTGAQLMSLACPQDENKVFGINFRTPPADSTGIAHILEHSVLCGSEKYPVKEPFVEMLKGSLKTYLNAFTYPDKTCYPVASQNLQDFHNLVDVYLDAVFHPRLTPETLKQEGWHYEVEGDNLTYKGVVFNEMKGAYSSPERVLGEAIQRGLFPDNTYGVESGGHPRHIPDLTWEQFEAFHRDFYHPSNALIWFYGDDPVAQRFEILESYLARFERREVDSAVAVQPHWTEPRTIETTYAVSAEEDASDEDGEEGKPKKHFVTVNWLLEDGIDYGTRLGLQVLDHVLLGSSAAPLRKMLIDSGLGEDVAGGGMDTELRQLLFSVGLKGVKAADEGQVEGLVVQALQTLARDGIDPETVKASLNTTEFRLRENNTGSSPRGISLMLRSLSTWLYGDDPFEPLAFEAPLAALKERIGLGRYFEGLIETHLLDNPHRTTVYVRPDVAQSAREEAEEKARLAEVRASMSAADMARVAAEAADLKARQEAPDDPADLAKIPTLSLDDIDRKIRQIPVQRTEVAGVRTLYHDLFTNGIVYFDIGFDLRTLPTHLLPYVSLFGRCLLEIGTQTEDFVRLSQRIGSRTGGLWATSIVTNHREQPEPVGLFLLRGKAMLQQTGDLLDVVRDVLLTTRFDNPQRFLQMALEEKAGDEAGLIPGGHAVATLRLKAQFTEASWAIEQMEGLSNLFFLRELVHQIETDWASVLARLEAVRDHLVNRKTMLVNATFPAQDRALVEPHIAALVQALPARPVTTGDWAAELRPANEGLTLPAQVNYVAKGGNLFDLGYELQGSVSVITKYLRNSYLWDRVRVQGGAYGAFCGFDHFTGIFTFTSYRDPNLQGTIDAYDGAAAFLQNLQLSDEELTKSIIGTIGELDSYHLPDAKGYVSMLRELTGVNDEYRQQMRDAVLATSAEDFRQFGDILARMNDVGRVVVLGSKDAISGANAARGRWLDVIAVM
ncbi:MAG: insulinase family protein [bacterium]|nr:insulinase family protein [bacterium]